MSVYPCLFWLRSCTSNEFDIFKIYVCSHCESCSTWHLWWYMYDIMMNSNPRDNNIVLKLHILMKHGASVMIWKKCSLFFPLDTFSHSFPSGIIKFNLVSLQEQRSHELDAILRCWLNSTYTFPLLLLVSLNQRSLMSFLSSPHAGAVFRGAGRHVWVKGSAPGARHWPGRWWRQLLRHREVGDDARGD